MLPQTASGMHANHQQETNSYGTNPHAVGATPSDYLEGASTYRMGGMEQSNGYSLANHNVREADRMGGMQQSNGYNQHAGVAD